jgi:very-short-patch-repair endonuclease
MTKTTRNRLAEVIEEGKTCVLEQITEEYHWRFDHGPNESESPIEELMYAALTALLWSTGGIYAFHQQVSVGDYRVDFLMDYTDPHMTGDYVASVAIECDGHDFHEKTKEQAKRDKQRDRNLLALELPTLRFTGSEVYADPFKCVREAMDLVSDLYYQRVLGPSKVAQ